jgi:hypothetical protein
MLASISGPAGRGANAPRVVAVTLSEDLRANTAPHELRVFAAIAKVGLEFGENPRLTCWSSHRRRASSSHSPAGQTAAGESGRPG